jgi:acyl-ACP thioesterase
VDAQGKLPLPSLAKFMQETAYNHANHLGFGYTQLNEKNLFWVLSRLIIKMDSYPRWLDNLQVCTWPSGVESLLAYRDFAILDGAGNRIGAAGSAWLALDAERRRPQRMTLLKEKEHLFPDQSALKEKPVKIPALTDPQQETLFPVRYSDLDLYDHVNNARYMQWVVDSYPEDLLRRFEIGVFEINFLSETKLSDEILLRTQQIETSQTAPIFLHSLHRASDQRAVCAARVTWRLPGNSG